MVPAAHVLTPVEVTCTAHFRVSFTQSMMGSVLLLDSRKLSLSTGSVERSPALLDAFFKEFCSEEASEAKMCPFDRFTFQVAADEDFKIVWPLCYVAPFLAWVQQSALSALVEDARHASTLSLENHGVEWEFIARFSIGVVASCAGFRDLDRAEMRVIGPVPPDVWPTVKIVRLPTDIETVDVAQEYLINLMHGSEPLHPACRLSDMSQLRTLRHHHLLRARTMQGPGLLQRTANET